VIPEEDLNILDNFIEESRAMIREILPSVSQLLATPEEEPLLVSVVNNGYRLFHSIKGTGAFFHLEHLTAPAEAMESLLEGARSDPLTLSVRHIALIAEACTFTEQGLEIVAREKSDQRLAAAAGSLQAAILESLYSQPQHSSSDQIAFTDISPEMREAFLLESERLLATAEQEFVLWDFIAIDRQRVGELCRVLHRLKQNFALYECVDFERLCMALESTLNRYIQGEFFQTEYPERVFLRCIDTMRESLSRYDLIEKLEIADLEEHLIAVQGLIRQPLGELLIEAGLVDPGTVDEALSLQRSAPKDLPRRLGEVLVAMGEVTEEQVEHVLKEQQHRKVQVSKAEEKLSAQGAPASPTPSIVPLYSQEVRVDGQTLARMASVVQQIAALSLPPESKPFITELEQLIRSCGQESPQGMGSQLQRIVHDCAVQFNKRIHFRVEGINFLQDKLDMSRFVNLLLPLLRNAVQHGAEPAAQRTTSGKKKNCRISLSGLCQEGEIWVSVEDDGTGFDLKKIAKLCFDQGLVGKEELSRITGAELLQIFLNNQHGTAEPVANESVRCTGLANVKQMLQDYNGKMDIWSRPGKGARITLRLPRSV
jgi:two-component system chemotaxis sensor kinase CheA